MYNPLIYFRADITTSLWRMATKLVSASGMMVMLQWRTQLYCSCPSHMILHANPQWLCSAKWYIHTWSHWMLGEKRTTRASENIEVILEDPKCSLYTLLCVLLICNKHPLLSEYMGGEWSSQTLVPEIDAID